VISQPRHDEHQAEYDETPRRRARARWRGRHPKPVHAHRPVSPPSLLIRRRVKSHLQGNRCSRRARDSNPWERVGYRSSGFKTDLQTNSDQRRCPGPASRLRGLSAKGCRASAPAVAGWPVRPPCAGFATTASRVHW